MVERDGFGDASAYWYPLGRRIAMDHGIYSSASKKKAPLRFRLILKQWSICARAKWLGLTASAVAICVDTRRRGIDPIWSKKIPRPMTPCNRKTRPAIQNRRKVGARHMSLFPEAKWS